MQITTGEQDLARKVLLSIYSSLPKWKLESLFVCVKIDKCKVYTICDHIKAESRTKFKVELEKLANIAIKK